MSASLQTIRLYGVLGSRFGRVHHYALESNTVAEAVQALCSQLKGFSAFMVQSKDRGVGYAVFADKKNLSKEQLRDGVGKADIRIAPVILGSKNAGVFQIILGVVMLAVAYIFPVTAPYLVPAAIGMIAGGLVQLLTPVPKGTGASSGANQPSYSFNGAVNTEAQGHPVPLFYGGPMKIGSAVVSGGISTADTATGAVAPRSGSESMGHGGDLYTSRFVVP